MKAKLLLTLCSLSGLLSSCSLVGIYTRDDIKKEARIAELHGFEQGRALEARTSMMRYQTELERSQPEYQSYQVPVPAHITPDGVKIEQHYKNLEIVTQ